jgi:DNA repair exonuclease SbcCD ATPase subunit
MLLEQIKAKNFLSFGNAEEMVKLDTPGLHFLAGKNGSGKSSIQEAITFALFGKTARNVKKNELVNKINRKDCRVELTFTQRDNRYKIIRGISPNIFEIYKDDVLVSQSSTVIDYQLILEKEIIGYNFDLFRQLVVLNPTSFVSFFEMKSRERRNLLEELLGLHEIGLMNQSLQSYIAENKSQVSSINGSIREVQTSSKTISQGLTEAKSKKHEEESNIHNLIEDLISKRKMVQEKVDEIYADIDSLNITEVEKHIEEHDSLIQKMQSVISEYKVIIQQYTKELNFLEQHESCPLCKQHIDETHKNALVTDLTEKTTKSSEKISAIDNKINEFSETRRDLSSTVEKYIKLNDTLRQLNSAIMLIDRDISSASDKLNTVNSNFNVDFLSTELQKSMDRLLELEESLTELTKQSSLYQSTKEFLSDNGIRRIIINKYIPYITARINYWLETMDYFAKVEIAEDFEETIKVRGFDPTRYASLSSGEKAKLTLSLVFAFRELLELRNNSSIQYMMVDEIIENVDADGKIGLMWHLRNIAEKTNSSIFVVSHGIQNTDPFNNIITVTKPGNFTKITSSSIL